MKVVFICAALAVGEAFAAADPMLARMWPFFAVLAVLVALFGYGYSLALWVFPFWVLFGVSLFFHAAVDKELLLRQSPWLRDARSRPSAERCRIPVKADFSRCIGIGLEHDRQTASVNRAILLGERRLLSYRTRQAFVESGAIHVFAVSGLHVMIVSGPVKVLLALLFVPYRYLGLLAVPLLWGYVFLVGSPPSAIRAALMATFNFCAPVFGRKADSLRSWSLSFIIVHVVDPGAITNVGSLMSFAVMLALVVVNRESGSESGGFKKTLWATFFAWAAGVPIAAQVFGRFSPGGLLSNLVLFAAAEYSVCAGAIGMVFGFFCETLARHLNNLSALFTGAMVGVAHAVSSIPLSSIDVCRWGWVESIEWYAAMMLAFFLVRLVRRRRNLV